MDIREKWNVPWRIRGNKLVLTSRHVNLAHLISTMWIQSICRGKCISMQPPWKVFLIGSLLWTHTFSGDSHFNVNGKQRPTTNPCICWNNRWYWSACLFDITPVNNGVLLLWRDLFHGCVKLIKEWPYCDLTFEPACRLLILSSRLESLAAADFFQQIWFSWDDFSFLGVRCFVMIMVSAFNMLTTLQWHCILTVQSLETADSSCVYMDPNILIIFSLKAQTNQKSSI